MDPKNTPETVVLQNGLPAGSVATADGTIQVEPTQRLQNASASGTGVPSVRLTTYACGLRDQAVDQLIRFLVGYVPAPIKFDYAVRNAANNFAVLLNGDQVGLTGESQVVAFESDTFVAGKLQCFGLATPITEAERRMADATPGDSALRQEQRRVRWLTNMLRRSRAFRVLSLYNKVQNSATGISLSAKDPLAELRPVITAVAKECGDRSMVRILFGAAAWDKLLMHAKFTGGAGGGYTQPWDEAGIARLLQLPAANVKISYHQFQKAAQGGASDQDYMLASDEIWIFAMSDAPDTEEDGSFAKLFHLQQGGGEWDVQIFKNRRTDLIDQAAFELLATTNSKAFSRLKYTT